MHYRYKYYPEAPKTTRVSKLINRPSVSVMFGVFIAAVLIPIGGAMYRYGEFGGGPKFFSAVGSVTLFVGLAAIILFPFLLWILFNHFIGNKVAEKERLENKRLIAENQDKVCFINNCLFVYGSSCEVSDIADAIKNLSCNFLVDFGEYITKKYAARDMLLPPYVENVSMSGFSIYRSKDRTRILEVSGTDSEKKKLYLDASLKLVYLMDMTNGETHVMKLRKLIPINDFSYFILDELKRAYV